MHYPFLTPAFLDALTQSASVGTDTGWHPCPVQLRHNGALLASMPLYLKTHSWGEYVFDWAWADAYRRHGLAYYPKLVTAIPFTPATGPRVNFAAGADRHQVSRQLVDRIIELAGEYSASSWHLLFPDADLLALLDDKRLLRRTGTQFHWFNRGYRTFDEFLGRFNARKRKMVRRERRRVAEQGISVQLLAGTEIDAGLWDFFYNLYQRTYRKRSGSRGYLTREFFRQVGRSLPDQVILAVARRQQEPIACALYFRDSDCLYGRYWGSLMEVDCLHFELCYYQGIDYAIAHGLQRFDAGAQGEHKILRGFEPVATQSLHWIADPRFAAAIKHFADSERLQVEDYIREARTFLPYRQAVSEQYSQPGLKQDDSSGASV